MILALLAVWDTVSLSWPDTVVVLSGFFSDSVRCQREFSVSGDTVRVRMQAGDTCLLMFARLPDAWTKARALFTAKSPEQNQIALLKPEEPANGLIISGTKTTSLSLSSTGTSLEDATGIRVSGSSMGVQLDGYIEENGFTGNQFTGQLAQLDKAYLRAQKGQTWLSVGNLSQEFQLGQKSAQARFMGITGAHGDFRAAAGYTPGQFVRKTFRGDQAFQGPYQLTSSDQAIVQGSDRVYINGVLMMPDRDYTLDPVAGSLVFTPDRVIKAEDRIVCEFQATRSGKNTYSTWASVGSARLQVQGFASWDRLSGIDPSLLEGAGDSDRVMVPGGRYVGSGNGSYTKQDTVYSYVGPGNGDWEVSFTYAGDSVGSYIYDSFLGGYKFVGTGAGDYIPYIYVSPPKQQEYTALKGFWSSKNYSASYLVSGSRHNGNTASDALVKTGLKTWAEMSWQGDKLGWWLSGMSRGEGFRHPFGNGTGQEDRNWGITDPGTASRDEMQTRITLRPWSWMNLVPGLGYARIGDISALRQDVAAQVWFLRAGFQNIDLNTGSWVKSAWLSAEPRVFGWQMSSRLNREKRDTLDLWSGEIGASGLLARMAFDLSAGYSSAISWRRFWARCRASRAQHTLSYFIARHEGDSVSVQQQLGARTGYGPVWLSADLDITTSALTQERFVFVGPGQGDWDYDSSNAEFYPMPGGNYIRQRVILGQTRPAVAQRLDAGLSLEGASFSVSASRNLLGDSCYYQDYSSNLSLSRSRFFFQANAWYTLDQNSLPSRRMASGSGETGLRSSGGQPAIEWLYDESWWSQQQERQVISGGPYFKFSPVAWLDLKVFSGTMRATEESSHPGVVAVLFYTGLEPDISKRLGPVFLSLLPNITYRWGDTQAGLTQVYLVYPPGLSYTLYAALKIGTTGSITLSSYLRGDTRSLKDKRLSLSGSVVF